MKPIEELPGTEYPLNTFEGCPFCETMYERKGDLENDLIYHHAAIYWSVAVESFLMTRKNIPYMWNTMGIEIAIILVIINLMMK